MMFRILKIYNQKIIFFTVFSVMLIFNGFPYISYGRDFYISKYSIDARVEDKW